MRTSRYAPAARCRVWRCGLCRVKEEELTWFAGPGGCADAEGAVRAANLRSYASGGAIRDESVACLVTFRGAYAFAGRLRGADAVTGPHRGADAVADPLRGADAVSQARPRAARRVLPSSSAPLNSAPPSSAPPCSASRCSAPRFACRAPSFRTPRPPDPATSRTSYGPGAARCAAGWPKLSGVSTSALVPVRAAARGDAVPPRPLHVEARQMALRDARRLAEGCPPRGTGPAPAVRGRGAAPRRRAPRATTAPRPRTAT